MSRSGSEGQEAALSGSIRIAGTDVAAAAPGNYTGITTFTITSGESADPDNPEERQTRMTGSTDDTEDPGSGELDVF